MRPLSGTVAIILMALAAPSGLAEDISNGRALSERHCSRCHVVGDFNKFGGIGSTPSFQLLVNGFDDWRDRFDSFHLRRPHPAFVRVLGFEYPDPTVLPPNAAPVEIEFDDIAEIRAFAETLKTE